MAELVCMSIFMTIGFQILKLAGGGGGKEKEPKTKSVCHSLISLVRIPIFVTIRECEQKVTGKNLVFEAGSFPVPPFQNTGSFPVSHPPRKITKQSCS